MTATDAIQASAVAAATAVDNPYYREWEAADHGRDRWGIYGKRTTLVKQYAWAVPDAEALEIVAALGPLVEIGAGNGYWAHLLRQMGVDAIAYDAHPPGCGRQDWFGNSTAWTEVLEGGPEAAALHPDRTLLLCWPCYAKPMARECLEAYGGDTLVYIGEGAGGCNADRDFFAMLGEEPCYACSEGRPDDCWHEGPCSEAPAAAWTLDREYALPQWDGIHDRLYVYRRAEPPR